MTNAADDDRTRNEADRGRRSDADREKRRDADGERRNDADRDGRSDADGESLKEAVAYIPELLYAGGRFQRARALVCDADGRVRLIVALDDETAANDEALSRELRSKARFESLRVVRLKGRALLPGMVNAHSHAFQRVIRGRTEHRSAASRDSFWTWREMMYAASARLTPEDLYDASRMAFMEMALAGVTTVGEFHYLHRTAEGDEYDDPNLLAKQVIAAARDCGLRIALLRVAYARAGYKRPADDRQRRFIETDPAVYLRNIEALIDHLAREADDGDAGESSPASSWVGVAPHSVRAVPLDYLRELRDFAAARSLPLHMHVAEQPAELEACVEETGRTPVRLLSDEGVLAENFTGVHAVHITTEEVRSLADARACVCACPTTERNLGDGVVPADALFDAGVSIALGSDSHTQIDILEDARELEYHLRLQRLARNVLAPDSPRTDALAARLFECATVNGARSLGFDGGEFAPGATADFFTVALDDPTIAGAETDDLLASVVFSASRAALRDTAVGGRLVVEDGRHREQDEIVARFRSLQRKLWND